MFKYFAFISYNSKDYKWGKKLQNKLEHFKLPSTLCQEHGLQQHPIKPVFFAPSDIQPGDLSQELQKRLKESKHLIVICSPSSAKSKWVSQEINYFYNLGRVENIHLFIIKGSPNFDDETNCCFNPILKELGIPEILGANIQDGGSIWPWINRERAYIQLITKLLDIEFDTLWNRHRRILRKRIATNLFSFLILIFLCIGIRITSLPTDVCITFTEESPKVFLPPINKATISLFLDNEIKYDTIHSFTENAKFNNIPHRYLGKTVRITVNSDQYTPIDTSLLIDKEINLKVERNTEYYGAIRFKLWHPYKTMNNQKVFIGNFETSSDDNGFVSLDIPIDKQRCSYPIKLESKKLVDSIFIMPSGKMRVIEVKP